MCHIHVYNWTILLACTQSYVCQLLMIIKSVCFPFGYQYIAPRPIRIRDSPYNVIHMESGWLPLIFFTCMQINSCSQLPLILTSRDLGHHASLKTFQRIFLGRFVNIHQLGDLSCIQHHRPISSFVGKACQILV